MIPSCSAWLPAFSVVGTIPTTPPAWLTRLAVLLTPQALVHHGFPNKIHAFGQNVPDDTLQVVQESQFSLGIRILK